MNDLQLDVIRAHISTVCDKLDRVSLIFTIVALAEATNIVHHW